MHLRWPKLRIGTLAWLLVPVAITAIDQASKQWAIASLQVRPVGSVLLFAGERLLVAFTFVRNPGAAWGLFADADAAFRRPFFFGVGTLAIALLGWFLTRLGAQQRLMRTALLVLLGGALGNFLDRLRFDYVVDFIDLRYASFRWPTFNVADMAISTGVALMLLEMILGKGHDTASPPQEPPTAG